MSNNMSLNAGYEVDNFNIYVIVDVPSFVR